MLTVCRTCCYPWLAAVSVSFLVQLYIDLHMVEWCTEDKVGGQWHWKRFDSCVVEMQTAKMDRCCVYVCARRPGGILCLSVAGLHMHALQRPLFLPWLRRPVLKPPAVSCVCFLSTTIREVYEAEKFASSFPLGAFNAIWRLSWSTPARKDAVWLWPWAWNWPFYWIWWSITAQMEVQLPQGKGDIA